MSGQQGQVDLSQQVNIALPLGAWYTVMNMLGKGPWETADPLIQAIRVQLQNVGQVQAPAPRRPKPVELDAG